MVQQKPHVALFPSPGMGHIIPMVELSKRLFQKHDLSVILIIPCSGLHPNEEKSLLESTPKGISLILLPRPDFDDSQTDPVLSIFNVVAGSLPALRDALRSLVSSIKLVSLVVDFLGTAAFDVANEFNVSPYIFFASNAMLLSLYLCLPELDTTVSGRYQDLTRPVQVPGCIPLRGEDLPRSFQDRQSPTYKCFVNQTKRYKMAKGILVNTFKGTESGTIKVLQGEKNYPPIYPIGPIVRQTDADTTNPSKSAFKIMKWLNDQPHRSVLFVCFGSMGLLSQPQIHELAFGLELSGKGFIWVVRGVDSDAWSLLPKGFVERTKDRGLLVPNWAPQAEILAHESTGGFLTHCGWNSVQESVLNGMPMIAWPLYAEQKMNAALLAEHLKIAIRPGVRKEDGLVGRLEIADSVKNLMEGEQGKNLRERTRALKVAGEMALDDVGGHSAKSLADFASSLKPQ